MEDDDSAFSSDDSDYSASSPMRSDAPPLGHEIQAAIDQGDWSAVGATAAILAPDDPSPTTSEMDTLVNSGNWSGIVAVAAKYADDASIQSGHLRDTVRIPSLQLLLKPLMIRTGLNHSLQLGLCHKFPMQLICCQLNLHHLQVVAIQILVILRLELKAEQALAVAT